VILTGTAINRLLEEPKPAVQVAALVPPTREKRGHRENQVQVTGTQGSNFRLVVRELVRDPLDFSVTLAYEIPGSTRIFRLRRHNGASHSHTNKLEGTRLTGFHVHMATERYQTAGFKEEAYAESTDAYESLSGAIEHMLEAAGFEAQSQGSFGV